MEEAICRTSFFLFLSQEQNDIKKNSVQLDCNNTILCCQLHIYIIKKMKNYIKTRGT